MAMCRPLHRESAPACLTGSEGVQEVVAEEGEEVAVVAVAGVGLAAAVAVVVAVVPQQTEVEAAAVQLEEANVR